MGIRGSERGGARSRGIHERPDVGEPPEAAGRLRRPFRARWEDLCASVEFTGRWIAADQIRYEPGTREPSEVEVVDVDDDLASLCTRMRASNRTSCCVLHCLPKVARPRSAAPPKPSA